MSARAAVCPGVAIGGSPPDLHNQVGAVRGISLEADRMQVCAWRLARGLTVGNPRVAPAAGKHP